MSTVERPVSAWRLLSLVVVTCLACSPAFRASGRDVAQTAAVDGAALPSMPEREHAFIELLVEARRQYEAASPGLARQQSRLETQIRLVRFMNGFQDIEDWVGIVRSSHTNREGDRSIRIEIAPGILVTTGDNRQNDPDLITLIEPHSPIYAAIDSLGVGQPVIFSGRMLTGRLSTDDDMMERPQIYARFSSLRAAQ
jgi:hypothetical protein